MARRLGLQDGDFNLPRPEMARQSEGRFPFVDADLTGMLRQFRLLLIPPGFSGACDNRSDRFIRVPDLSN
jgi:hypothetical protein